MLIAPALNQIVFTVANWLGSSRLPKIFRSRGYLLGTSQVTCPMPGKEPVTLVDAFVVRHKPSFTGRPGPDPHVQPYNLAGLRGPTLYLHRQVLLENAHRGSAPTNGSDAGGAVPPRVSGVPATLPLVSIPSKKIEEIYLQVRRPGPSRIVATFAGRLTV